MKGKFAFVLCALFCAVSAFAEDECFYLGANYSYLTAGGYGSHAVGGHLSFVEDRVYAAVGFLADVSGDRNIEMEEMRGLGVGKFETKTYAVPMRVGYPFMLGGESAALTIIPALAVDAQFLRAEFGQEIDGYEMNYKMSGFGATVGAALNIGMQHRIGRVCLMYGIDMDFGLLSFAVYRFDYSGYVSKKHVAGSGEGTSFSSVADGLQFAVSPYLCVGFSL